MIKDSITKKLDIDFSLKGWDKTFKTLDEQGRLDHRTLIGLVKILCEEIEVLENKVEGLLPQDVIPIPKKKNG